MKLTRRDAIKVSGTAVAGLSMGVVKPDRVLAQEAQEFPDRLVEAEIRTRADLPLNADGSAPEHAPGSAGPIDGVIYRYTGGEAPDTDLDYRTASIRIAASRLSRLHGTLRHEDLADLPGHSMVTLLQCGAPRPTGIVKWTGVRFNDVLDMIGLAPTAHYCRIISHDGYYTDEEVPTMRHPQTMLVWMLNDEPLPPVNGAPFRLVIPFRYGGRSVKAVREITFGSPSLPFREVPTRGA